MGKELRWEEAPTRPLHCIPLPFSLRGILSLCLSLRSCSLLLDERLPIHIIKLVLGQSQSLACLVRSSVDAISCCRETETEFPEMHSTYGTLLD